MNLEHNNITYTPARLGLRGRYQEFNRKYPWVRSMGFFAGGVLFDVLMVGRIDELHTTIQMGLYLLTLSFLVSLELVDEVKKFSLPPWLQKIWHYREEAIHFLFGTLLNIYTIFYLKSASFFTSFLFLALIAGLIVANELPGFRRFGTKMRFALLALSYASYFCYLVPILWGNIGVVPFFLSLVTSFLVMLAIFYILLRQIADLTLLIRQVLAPSFTVLSIFMLFYLWGIIPPVPLSLQYIGVFHRVEKAGDKYKLAHLRPWWKFWENGDQTFFWRSGDRVHVFARIFSPARFNSKVFVRWSHKEEKRGWQTWDAIPIQISGGREEGFRGIAIKENIVPGEWRVQFETEDQREIGRLYVTIENDTENSERDFRYLLQ